MEVTGGLEKSLLHNSWRSFINCTLHKILGSQIKENEIGGNVATHGTDGKLETNFLVGKHGGKNPLERPWHKREDDIKMDLR
jgi:hypothetical protein